MGHKAKVKAERSVVDKIEELITHNVTAISSGCHDQAWVENEEVAAEAIFKALPGFLKTLIPDLEFTEYAITGDYVDGCEVLERSLAATQYYFLSRRVIDNKFVVALRALGQPAHVAETKEDVIAWANEHHRALILSELGWG